MVSTDLSEIAQSGINQIVEDHRAGQAQTNRHILRWTAIFFVLFLATSVWNVLTQQVIGERIGQPQPAAVHLSLTSAKDNPVLCPGDIFDYTVHLDIMHPLTGRAIVVVRNLDTQAQEASSGTDIIWHVDQRSTDIQWQVPLTLPATPSRPERQWAAGNYAREIAIVSYEANQQAEPQAIPFRIGADCPNAAK